MTFSKAIFIWIAGLLTACGQIDQWHQLDISFSEPSRRNVDKSLLILNPEKGLVYFEGQPFSGNSIRQNSNGVVVERIAYIKGKRSGALRKWYSSSQLSFEAFYKDNKLNGTSRTWWRDGTLRSESNHKAGTVHGVQKQWYKSGAIFKKRNIVNGKEDGIQRAWRENGQLYTNYEARNGRTFGLKRSKLCFELENELIPTDE